MSSVDRPGQKSDGLPGSTLYFLRNDWVYGETYLKRAKKLQIYFKGTEMNQIT